MLARLMAYVGALALLAIVGIHLWDRLPFVVSLELSRRADGSLATRSYPAFADSHFVSFVKTEAYEIFRLPGGRPQGRHSPDGCGRPTAARRVLTDESVKMLAFMQLFCLRTALL
jgi:hypothetical protein